MGKSP